MSGAVLIAGTHSGCGKTTVSLGIMAALTLRGVDVRPFKCGPDFIDPTLHRLITGRSSRNLDLRMCGESFVRRCFADQMDSDTGDAFGLIEGVMGLFDGGQGSAATLATCLGLPVVLVVDVRSAAESVAAVVHGFEALDARVRVRGVILNRMGSERHRRLVCDAVRRHCRAEILGVLSRDESVGIPSRHLGLHMDEDGPFGPAGVEYLAGWAAAGVDLDRLVTLGATCAVQEAPEISAITSAAPVRIGVARDRAFCFYYEDNLELLEKAGAQLIRFSPLHDQALPEGLQGIYLGGGYPELYAKRLSENTGILRDILEFAKSGRPVYAECGGFMYLCRTLRDLEGNSHAMAGFFPATVTMRPRLQQLGYRCVEQVRRTFFGPKGLQLHGHEFHYSELEEGTAPGVPAYRLDNGRHEGYGTDSVLGGYVHLHWGRTPAAAAAFVQACRDF
ncbi:MAG: cobyrinic acid a,c-diamide synthase [Desulfobulbus propionicus]|nr:MAG: cobyrinic acid a,c-diamide synthase [Desulfobulbus propionicus]